MPQGAILGPILLKIFLADLFFVLKEVDIANFDNNNTPYTSSKNTDEFIESLEKAPNTLFQWFTSNLFKGNPDKSHLIVKKNQKTNVNIREYNIESSDGDNSLGVKIDNKLTFDCHVSGICKKASIKINKLARIAPYINIGKRRIIMNSFFMLKFNNRINYCNMIIDMP